MCCILQAQDFYVEMKWEFTSWGKYCTSTRLSSAVMVTQIHSTHNGPLYFSWPWVVDINRFSTPSSGQLLWWKIIFFFCFLSQCLWCRKCVQATCTVCGRAAHVCEWTPHYWGLSTWRGLRVAAATSLRVEVSWSRMDVTEGPVLV